MIIIDGHLSAFARVDNCLDASFLPPNSHHCKHLETLLKRCKTKGATGANLAMGACRTTWPGGTRGISWRQSVGNSDSGFQVFAKYRWMTTNVPISPQNLRNARGCPWGGALDSAFSLQAVQEDLPRCKEESMPGKETRVQWSGIE